MIIISLRLRFNNNNNLVKWRSLIGGVKVSWAIYVRRYTKEYNITLQREREQEQEDKNIPKYISLLIECCEYFGFLWKLGGEFFSLTVGLSFCCFWLH